MGEGIRGCGYRKIGGLYLVSDPSAQLECDALPLPIEACDCCGFEPPFSRNFQWIHTAYIAELSQRKHRKPEGCRCNVACPVCFAPTTLNVDSGKYGFMYVSKRAYTPPSFVKEAVTMGVSKRIPDIPKGLVLGKTLVLLAHNKVPTNFNLSQTNGLAAKEPEYMTAIFYGFIPQRVELLVWKGQYTNDELLQLKEKGITPVILEPTPENRKRHGTAKGAVKTLAKILNDAEAKEMK